MLLPPPIDPADIPGLPDGLRIRQDLVTGIGRLKSHADVFSAASGPVGAGSWAYRTLAAVKAQTAGAAERHAHDVLRAAGKSLDGVDHRLHELLRVAVGQRVRRLGDVATDAAAVHGAASPQAVAAAAAWERSRMLFCGDMPLADLAAFCGLSQRFPTFSEIEPVSLVERPL